MKIKKYQECLFSMCQFSLNKVLNGYFAQIISLIIISGLKLSWNDKFRHKMK